MDSVTSKKLWGQVTEARKRREEESKGSISKDLESQYSKYDERSLLVLDKEHVYALGFILLIDCKQAEVETCNQSGQYLSI